MKCAKNLKSAYAELLAILIEVESRQIYLQLEVTSLYAYCTEFLGLPNHTAYDFIDVVRTSKLIPELANAVITGRTTISKARRICAVITPTNQKAWIELAAECTYRVVQRAVAMANPRAGIMENQRFVSGDVLEIKFAVSVEWSQLLTDVKDQMSQKKCRAVSTEETLFALLADYKAKHDPVAKAERAKSRSERLRKAVGDGSDEAKRFYDVGARVSENQRTAGPVESCTTTEGDANKLKSKRIKLRNRYRPMSVEHHVDLRDGNQCTYVNRAGSRCTSKRWLAKHHIIEFGRGGQHVPENLETLCSAHHRMRHQQNGTH